MLAEPDRAREPPRFELRVKGECGGGAEEAPGAASWSSSLTIDCLLLALCSSSSSSAISINRLRRSELVEEDVDPEAACSEHAADNLVSLSSLAAAMENVVSYGANRSQTELK